MPVEASVGALLASCESFAIQGSDLLNDALGKRARGYAWKQLPVLRDYARHVVTVLSLEPEVPRHAAKLLEPHSHIWRNGRIACQYSMKRLACNAQISRYLTDGHLQGRDNTVAKQLAGMADIFLLMLCFHES